MGSTKTGVDRIQVVREPRALRRATPARPQPVGNRGEGLIWFRPALIFDQAVTATWASSYSSTSDLAGDGNFKTGANSSNSRSI